MLQWWVGAEDMSGRSRPIASTRQGARLGKTFTDQREASWKKTVSKADNMEEVAEKKKNKQIRIEEK